MKKCYAVRRLLSGVLTAAFLFLFPLSAAGQEAACQQIPDAENPAVEPYALPADADTTPDVQPDLPAATPPDGIADTAAAEDALTVPGDAVTPPDSNDVPVTPSGEETNEAPPDPPSLPSVASVTTVPEEGAVSAGDAVTLFCETEGASIYYATSPDGETFSDMALYTQPIPTESGFGTLYIRAAAVKAGCSDGPETTFCFTEEAPPEPAMKQARKIVANGNRNWIPYFGLLHAHTSVSDGLGSVEDAFSSAAEVEGLDFFAVTDHSNSFQNALDGNIGVDGSTVSADWAAGKAAAAAVTNDSFAGIYGYEMTWPEGKGLGHINTFNTPGWQSRDQETFWAQPTALESYYAALASVPGSVSQFNHPDDFYGNFERFSHYTPEADEAITLLEVGSEGAFTGYDAYTLALDLGWHVAPTNNQNNHAGLLETDNGHRTVILAKELTESALYEAMRSRRVYATEDRDLSIYYTMNGEIMGSILTGGEPLHIRAELEDPTDEAIGEVAVIGDGGTVIERRQLGMPSAVLELDVPKGCNYYYLKITQPDGDVAVTAPVWVEKRTDFGIAGFYADTSTPVSGKTLNLTLNLYNNESEDLTVQSIRFTADGEIIHTVDEPVTVGNDGYLCTFPYTHAGAGTVTLQVEAEAVMDGERHTLEDSISLRFRVPAQVTKILVDGSHGNMGTDSLSRMTALAADAGVGVEVFSGKLPADGSILLITPPSEAFDEEFVQSVAEFARSGGTVFVCGQSDMGDWNGIHTASEMNRLLAAMEVSLRINDDTAWDTVNNGGTPDTLYTTVYNPDSTWCGSVISGQLYSQHSGCTVNAGSGVWLAKALDTTASQDSDRDGLAGKGAVLLAWEETAAGGGVFVSGSVFPADKEMKESQNKWDPVSINQTVLEKLLNVHRNRWPRSDISQVRSGKAGQVYRVRGWATSGTSRPGNIFPETLYLQDETGGIALVPFTQTGVQIGTPVDAVGTLEFRQGNPVLNLTDCQILDEDYYRFAPGTSDHKTAMDFSQNGGKLMQVEGKVTAFTLTEDEKGISRITLKDGNGDLAEVLIEDCIFSGANGENTLASQVKLGRMVRAMGILHLEADGTPVLRVRNCDEVVYVPPVPVPAPASSMNPYTGDLIWVPMGVMLCSGLALLGSLGRKKW